MAGQSGDVSRSKNPFFEEEDEAFLRQPRSGYMLPSSEAAASMDRREQLLQQKRRLEERTLQAGSRSLGLLHESEQIGIATAEELHKQREQLENTERRLDEINNSLRTSEKHIQNIKSVFSSIRSYFGGKSQPPPASSASSSKRDEEQDKGWAAYPPPEPRAQDTHPAMRIRGLAADPFEEEENLDSDDFSRRVDQELNRNLDDMSQSLLRLKGLGQGLGEEIESQNTLLGRLHDKADSTDFRIHRQNKEMNAILKK